MTIDELMALLESCHYAAEVRIAIPGAPPVDTTILGITSTVELSGPGEPGIAWLLAGATTGAIDAAAWDPAMRRKP